MREPGSDGNLDVMFFRSIVHHFTWNLLENMTNRFPHIPDFAWISHALPLNGQKFETTKGLNFCP